jgi:endonuclease III
MKKRPQSPSKPPSKARPKPLVKARPKPLVKARSTVPAKPRSRRMASAKDRAPEIYRRLAREYPDAKCALDHRNPYELLVATILSAQCTDRQVNIVTPPLFDKYPDASALAVANPDELQEMIRSTGFFRNKSKSLLGMANAVTEQHGGDVPRTMEQLVKLPGVGRKTANVVLGNAFDLNEGVVVDTHVSRLSNRLALSRETDPVKIESDLVRLFPREQWTMLSHLLISHGREICDARRPLCEQCVVNDLCPSSRV